MTEDHYWLTQQNERFAEEIQRSRLSFAEALDYRREITGVWNDSCARDVNGRFLNAMEDGGMASLDAMRRQQAALSRSSAEMLKAHEFFKIATATSAAVIRPTEEARSSFRTIESFLNHEMAEIRTADSHAEQTDRLIAEADRVGSSAEEQANYRD